MNVGTRILVEPGWQSHLLGEFVKPYMRDLNDFLRQEIARGKTIYPKESEYFQAFNATPFDKVKVVLLGQDPYHGTDQAHGLCFSVPNGVGCPPSLKNIFKEIQSDLNLSPGNFPHGNLQGWADQGVLMLNSILTVEAGRAGCHKGRGWEKFTDRAISALNENKDRIVFMLWGDYAQKKGSVVDDRRHLVLRAPHPSPLSAYKGFLGCRHFSTANAYLADHGVTPIDWRLT